jgi:putative ABC transport system permease protein
MRGISFWFIWSLRELRRRWVQVAVIALVIAIGTGVYAGLSSTSAWRRVSYNDSYAALNAHDLHVSLSDGSYVSQGELAGALADMQDPQWIDLAEERLLQPTQVEASTADETVLVPGRIVGVPTQDSGPKVDAIYVASGSGLSDNSGVVLEQHFVDLYKLPEQGTVELPGGVAIQYTGTGYSPEYFMVTSGQVELGAQADFAVLFMPIAKIQELSGRTGQVNDLVISLVPGIDRNAAAVEVQQALEESLPQVGVEVKTLEDDPAYHLLYSDLNSDQGTLIAIALLVLLGAAFAAFNLTSRVVEAERREIGISMALGVPRAKIALRPLLMGAEIAGLGILFGIGIGFLMGALMRPALSGLQPLPIWRTPFQVGPFAAAAAIGFLLPFLATAWPVWRAVRVEPVEAIRTGHLASKGGGLAPIFKRLRLPGKSLAQMPLRNVLRAPRRTILTALGIGASIVVLVAVLGALDSFDLILNRISADISTGAPNRINVALTDFQPENSELMQTIEGAPSIGEAEALLVGAARISNGTKELDISLQVQDMASPIWHPTVKSTAPEDGLPGIVLSEKAAGDLGIKPGDSFMLTHPVRTGGSTFALQQTQVRLIGLHQNPIRPLAFTDASNAGLFGLVGFTNALQITPAPGYSVSDLKQALFNLPGVASVQDPAAVVQQARDQIGQFTSIFQVIAGFVFLLALLIAFSAASISADEHRRENATMEAYGVRVRTLLRVAVIESGVVGVVGTLVGVGLGVLALQWLMARSAGTIPDLQLQVTLTAATIVITLAIGIAATAIAPLFNARKLRRMDVPSTLRVME